MDEYCTICMTSIGPTTHCTMVPCGHRFHAVCIQTWLVQRTTCPICRSIVSRCQHGYLEAHDAIVFLSVIAAQQEMIQSFKRDIQIAEDAEVVHQMHMELLMQELREYESQYTIFQSWLATPGNATI
jgi:hypothetical protein